jgi:hypothetical protein
VASPRNRAGKFLTALSTQDSVTLLATRQVNDGSYKVDVKPKD